MPSVHCLLNYRHIFRDAHDRINHHRSHAGAHWQKLQLPAVARPDAVFLHTSLFYL